MSTCPTGSPGNGPTLGARGGHLGRPKRTSQASLGACPTCSPGSGPTLGARGGHRWRPPCTSDRPTGSPGSGPTLGARGARHGRPQRTSAGPTGSPGSGPTLGARGGHHGRPQSTSMAPNRTRPREPFPGPRCTPCWPRGRTPRNIGCGRPSATAISPARRAQQPGAARSLGSSCGAPRWKSGASDGSDHARGPQLAGAGRRGTRGPCCVRVYLNEGEEHIAPKAVISTKKIVLARRIAPPCLGMERVGGGSCSVRGV